MSLRAAILSMGLVGLQQPALANASVNLDIKDGTGETYVPGSGSIEFGKSIVQGAAAASGYANLDSGVLKAQAVAPVGTNVAYADAQVGIADSISFSAGASGTAHLDYHWDGSLSAYGGSGPDSVASLQFYIVPGGQPPAISEQHVLTNANCGPYNVSSCVAGTSIDQTGSVAFAIAPGATSIQIFLTAYPSNGGSADFSNTGTFYLRLPDGVSYTSATGRFLATATPIVAVPEPGRAWLMAGGLLLLGRRARRGRSQRRVWIIFQPLPEGSRKPASTLP